MANEVYLLFARAQCPLGTLDESEEAAMAAYAFESRGECSDLSRNAYAVGKSWANVQVAEWKQGLAEGLFLREEFLEDPTLPRWWVESVLDRL